MDKKRKVFSGAFKARVALKAIREVEKVRGEGLAEVLEDGRSATKLRDQTPSEHDLQWWFVKIYVPQ